MTEPVNAQLIDNDPMGFNITRSAPLSVYGWLSPTKCTTVDSYVSLNKDNFSKIKQWIYVFSNQLCTNVELYCFTAIMKRERLPQTKEMVLAPKGAKLFPIVIKYKEDTDSFDWELESEKIAVDDWVGVPNEIAYYVKPTHKLLNYNILPQHHIMIKLPSPVLRSFPETVQDYFYSWYVGFVVDVSNLRDKTI